MHRIASRCTRLTRSVRSTTHPCKPTSYYRSMSTSGVYLPSVINGTALVSHSPNVLDTLENVQIPLPKLSADQVLIQVAATTVNPIDVDMAKGYGSVILDTIRPLPAILGRECTGHVAAVGSNVLDLKPGDRVWATPSPFAKNGCHADYVVCNASEVSLAPASLSLHEAVAIPYSALTAWKALIHIGQCVPSLAAQTPTNSLTSKAIDFHHVLASLMNPDSISSGATSTSSTTGTLDPTNLILGAAKTVKGMFNLGSGSTRPRSKYARGPLNSVHNNTNTNTNTQQAVQRVFIHGGSGAVGKFATQLLSNYGIDVVVSCSAKNHEIMKKLGAKAVVDYNTYDWNVPFISAEEKMDVILDCAGGEPMIDVFCKQLRKGGKLISVYKLLEHLSQGDILTSGITTAENYTCKKIDLKKKYDVDYYYAFFEPNVKALDVIAKLVDQGVITPSITGVVKTHQDAYELLQKRDFSSSKYEEHNEIRSEYISPGGKIIIDTSN